MARKQSSRGQGKSSDRRGKVGSDPDAVRQVGGKGDFGVDPRDRIETEYVSKEVKSQDPGSHQRRIKTGDSARESGAGAYDGGRGSSSGGDVDTDIIGVGTEGTGVSQHGPDDRTEGADMTTKGGTDPFAAPGPKGHKNAQPQQPRQRGTTVDRTGGDVSTTGAGTGAAAVTNPEAPRDDSFLGEVSQDEARGADNGPSDRGGR